MRVAVRSVCVLAGALAAFGAAASGGTKPYRLPWSVPGEVLVYRACGCGDACWVAEVRHARTRAVRSRLRCDCEALWFSRPGLTREHEVAGSCSGINGSDDKPGAIRRQLERLSGPEPGAESGPPRPARNSP